MAYIDREYYYSSCFSGQEIPPEEFERIAQIASDVIDSIMTVPINERNSEAVKRATAYEAEMLYTHGGVDAVLGFAEGVGISSEKLGDYSVTMSGSAKAMRTKDGIPVSPLCISILKKAGFGSRWAYAELYKRNGKL